MGYLFSHLAFLLLFTCCHAGEKWRQRIQNRIPWDFISERRMDDAAIVTADMKKELVKRLTGDPRSDVAEVLGNTFFAITFDSFKRWGKVEPHYRDAIYNGVLCDNITDFPEDMVRSLVYGRDTLAISNQQRIDEEKFASDPLFGMNCTSPTPDLCFCREKKLLAYCIALRMEKTIRDSGFIMKDCDDELQRAYRLELGANRTNGVDYYNRMYNTYELGEYYFGRDLLNAEAFDGKYDTGKLDFTEDDYYGKREIDTAHFFCEATEPRAANYVRDLYASNPMRWMLERKRYTAYGPMRMNVYLACSKDANFTATEFGSCLCAFDKGFAFCYYKVISMFIQKQGFLDCENLSLNRTTRFSLEPAFGMPASTTMQHFLVSAASILLLLLLN